MITVYPPLGSSSASAVNVKLPSTSSDAFGRLRISEAFTLFDSSHRYADNGLWVESITGTASSSFSTNEGLVNLSVGTVNGNQIIRETVRVFAYQPGKSLLNMNTFVMGDAKTNLRQRVGYFGNDNGFYLERESSNVYLVERSIVTGSIVNTRVAQANWNQDKLDGTGPSKLTLDLSKAQILYADIEWLGLGTVRMGFVIDGVFVPAHSFHHANLVTTTYITTASLPLRYEMTNIGTTASSSTLKQVCSTVISEGGYELRGLQQAIGTPITTSSSTLASGAFLPVVSLRLKSTRLDAIAILTAISIMGGGNSNNYNWQVQSNSTTTGGTWVSAGANSSVDYNITGTALTTSGRVLASGYFSSSNQSTSSVDILKEALFSFQLERNYFTSTPYELSLVVAGGASGQPIYGSMDWEEISR
jgi:hypothetical protein